MLICLFVILSCSSNNERTDNINSNNTLIEVLIHLDPPPLDYYQMHKVAEKYGFKFKHIANIISEKQLDSIHKVNKLAYSKLDKLNGNNWEELYDIDVLNEYKKDSIITSKIEKLDFIKKLNKKGQYLQFLVDSLVDKDIYRVSVNGWLNDDKWVSFFRIYFNYSNFTVESIEKNIKLIDDYSKK